MLTQGGPRAYLQPKQLVCPSGGGGYVYIPGQRNVLDPRNVVVFELPSNHKGEGGNVGWLDGHTSWRSGGTVAGEVQATLDNVILGRLREEPAATHPAQDNIPYGQSALPP
jgi:prepilin-type processing-associated H-X9-DG protein